MKQDRNSWVVEENTKIANGGWRVYQPLSPFLEHRVCLNDFDEKGLYIRAARCQKSEELWAVTFSTEIQWIAEMKVEKRSAERPDGLNEDVEIDDAEHDELSFEKEELPHLLLNLGISQKQGRFKHLLYSRQVVKVGIVVRVVIVRRVKSDDSSLISKWPPTIQGH